MTINVMYTIMSTSIVFLIKSSTQTISTMVFEHCVLSLQRPHDPTNVFHKVNIKSFLQIVKSTFVIFTSIFGRPAHQTPAYIIFLQSAKFRLL